MKTFNWSQDFSNWAIVLHIVKSTHLVEVLARVRAGARAERLPLVPWSCVSLLDSYSRLYDAQRESAACKTHRCSWRCSQDTLGCLQLWQVHAICHEQLMIVSKSRFFLWIIRPESTSSICRLRSAIALAPMGRLLTGTVRREGKQNGKNKNRRHNVGCRENYQNGGAAVCWPYIHPSSRDSELVS